MFDIMGRSRPARKIPDFQQFGAGSVPWPKAVTTKDGFVSIETFIRA